MHEKVQLGQDPQTKFATICKSLGVSRVNFILRVHDLLESEAAATTFDSVGAATLERLFPKTHRDGLDQATLSATCLALVARRPKTWCGQHHVGALVACEPRIPRVLAAELPARAGLARLACSRSPRNSSWPRASKTSNTQASPQRVTPRATIEFLRPHGEVERVPRNCRRSSRVWVTGRNCGGFRRHCITRERGNKSRAHEIFIIRRSPSAILAQAISVQTSVVQAGCGVLFL